MAAPVLNQEVGAVGLMDAGVSSGIIPGVTEERSTRTFRRTFQHHVNSFGSSTTETVSTPTGWNTRRYFDQGWYHIPYTNTAASMTSADVDATIGVCKNYEIIEQGFSIKRINVSQITATVRPDGARLDSAFVNNPQIMVWRDTDHDLFEDCFLAPTISATPIIVWDAAGGPNSIVDGGRTYAFQRPFLPSGLLSGVGNSTLRECCFGFEMDALTPVGQFDILNGGKVEFLGTQGVYDYSWKPLTKRLFEKRPDGDAGLPGPIFDTTHLFSNKGTGVVQNDTHSPMLHCIRVPPMYDTFGPLLLNVELLIEYHLTIAFTRGRYFYSMVRNLNPPEAPILGQVIQDRLDWAQSNRRVYFTNNLPNTRQRIVRRVKLPNTYRPDLHGSTRGRSSAVHASKQQ